MIRILALVAALVCAVPAIAQPLPANLDKANAIVIDTSKGRIVVKLRTDLAPQHAERIKQLAREGYYNNVPFHRVIEGFMAQTGDGKNFNGARGKQRFRQFAVLHHVRRRRVAEREVHRDRRSGVGHGRGRQDQARRTCGRSRQDGEGAGRIRHQVRP
jgi:hypothetical protein